MVRERKVASLQGGGVEGESSLCTLEGKMDGSRIRMTHMVIKEMHR